MRVSEREGRRYGKCREEGEIEGEGKEKEVMGKGGVGVRQGNGEGGTEGWKEGKKEEEREREMRNIKHLLFLLTKPAHSSLKRPRRTSQPEPPQTTQRAALKLQP